MVLLYILFENREKREIIILYLLKILKDMELLYILFENREKRGIIIDSLLKA